MKKKLLPVVLLIVVVLVVFFIYLMPSKSSKAGIDIVRCNANGAARVLALAETWSKILPGKPGLVGVTGGGFHDVGLWIVRDGDTAKGRLEVLNLGMNDSTALKWSFELARKSAALYSEIDSIISAVKSWVSHTENIYGIEMRDSMSKTTRILLIRENTPEYPTVSNVYGRVRSIRSYMAKIGAHAIDSPMLHVSMKTDSGYATIVGIPLDDNDVEGSGIIESKRYVPWKIMMGKVTGGPASAVRGYDYLQQYVTDHQKPAYGVPFELLVVNREAQADTSKWVSWVVQAIP